MTQLDPALYTSLGWHEGEYGGQTFCIEQYGETCATTTTTTTTTPAPATGACCYQTDMVDPETGEPTWACSDSGNRITQDACENPPIGYGTAGTWYEGMSCDDIDCPTTTQAPPASGGLEWACCGTGYTGYCISVTANECFTLGGTFYEYYTCDDVASGEGTECEGYGTTTPAPSGTTSAPTTSPAPSGTTSAPTTTSPPTSPTTTTTTTTTYTSSSPDSGYP